PPRVRGAEPAPAAIDGRPAGGGDHRRAAQGAVWGRGWKRWRSRPVSRVLSWATIPLGASSPIRSSNLPGPDAGNVMGSLFGLAPGGVCRAGLLPGSRCALTAPFHPCHASRRIVRRYLSVALSVGSRRPGVTWHRALWSPDFPRHSRRNDAIARPAPPAAIIPRRGTAHPRAGLDVQPPACRNATWAIRSITPASAADASSNTSPPVTAMIASS